MLGAIWTGWIAAVAVVLLGKLSERFSQLSDPLVVLLAVTIAILIQRFFLDRRRGGGKFSGLADLMIQIHQPSAPDSSLRWLLRSIISGMFHLCATPIGSEGAAIEAAQSGAMRLRSSSAKWFEQRRRTDVACAIAAGIAASFGAPMAGILLAMELGIGGRAISSVISAFSAFFFVEVAADAGWVRTLDLSSALYEFRISSFEQIVTLVMVIAATGAFAGLAIRFVRDSRNSVVELSRDQAWIRGLIAGICLVFLAFINRDGQMSPSALVESLLASPGDLTSSWIATGSFFLGFVLIIAGFGTAGVFWPVFCLGSLFGVSMAQSLGSAGVVAPISGIVGGAAFWGAAFGAPITISVLALEMTQNPYVLVPCFVAALAGREIRRRIIPRGLLESDLDSRGIRLLEGRSAAVLVSMKVGEVMSSDHEVVQEHEPITELHSRLLASRYQFLPVVSAQGVYSGLLTAEMVHDAWLGESSIGGSQGIGRIFEAKDVLYRLQFKAPTVHVSDNLTATAGLFRDFPCVAVVDDERKVRGLLFAHSVRVAYEREVARRSLVSVQPPDPHEPKLRERL
jgi:CIC family chloride channel protein